MPCGLVQRGEEMADGGFSVSINTRTQTHCDSASSCPGAQEPAPHPRPAWDLARGVGGWRESKQVWPCPLRQNLGSGSEISVLTAFQVMFVLDPGLWETLAQLDIGHLDSVTER